MKHFTRKAAVAAISTLVATFANAQYITEAPAGGYGIFALLSSCNQFFINYF